MPTGNDLQSVIDLINSAKDSYATLGLLAMLGTLLYGLVKLYRLPWVQIVMAKISPKLNWDAWPRGVKVLVIFGSSFALSFLTALATHLSWIPALINGFGAALAAIGADQTITGAIKAGEVKTP